MENSIVGEYREAGTDGCVFSLEASAIFTGKTQYQNYALLETRSYGKVLVIDGTIQVTESDQWIYHEVMVWMPMLYHPSPKRVLIIGGASGYAVKMALSFPTVEHIDLVEIDQEVLERASEFFGNIELWESSRVRLHFEDAFTWLARSERKPWDIILLDTTDPGNPCTSTPLQSLAFYSLVQRNLTKQGLFVAQAGSAWFRREQFRETYNLARAIFSNVRPMIAADATSRGSLAFVMAGSKISPVRFHHIPGCARFLTRAYADWAFEMPPYVSDFLEV